MQRASNPRVRKCERSKRNRKEVKIAAGGFAEPILQLIDEKRFRKLTEVDSIRHTHHVEEAGGRRDQPLQLEAEDEWLDATPDRGWISEQAPFRAESSFLVRHQDLDELALKSINLLKISDQAYTLRQGRPTCGPLLIPSFLGIMRFSKMSSASLLSTRLERKSTNQRQILSEDLFFLIENAWFRRRKLRNYSLILGEDLFAAHRLWLDLKFGP